MMTMTITGTAAIARTLRADGIMMPARRHHHHGMAHRLHQRNGGLSPCRRFRVVGAPSSSSFSSQSDQGDGRQNQNQNQNQNKTNRVPVALYRQLLSWCRKYDDVPFNPLPPVTLSPPQVNPLALRRLKGMRSFLDSDEINKDSLSGRDPSDPNSGIARFGSGRYPHPAHRAMYQEGVTARENMITFPEMKDADDLRATIRSVYWLNNERTIISNDNPEEERSSSAVVDDVDTRRGEEGGDNDYAKEQIALAFDAIRSCNQLSSNELDRRREKREISIRARRGTKTKTTGETREISGAETYPPPPRVEYHVGQVVKHAGKSWRGVVAGWEIDDGENDKKDDRLTSLTTKRYSLPPPLILDDGESAPPASKVKYTVLIDHADLKGERGGDNGDSDEDGGLLANSLAVVSQRDLEPVDDPCLQRINNQLIKNYFTRFDVKGHFVPNDILAYIFPLDRFSRSKYGDVINPYAETEEETKTMHSESKSSADAISNGVREIGRRLLLPLSKSNGVTSEDGDEVSPLVSSLTSSVQSMLSKNEPSTNLDSAIASLGKLYLFHVKINSLLWFRNANRQHEQRIDFSLGQVVKHKLYGFRGVVVAWDSKPRVDVSNWDGLKDVPDPNEKPFYHIYPDVDDCRRAFGGPRHFRYVCQDNLELSPHNEKPLELELSLDPEEWKWDGERGRYTASAEMKFMYAEDLGEHETALVETVRNLRKILTDCMLEIRDGSNTDLFSMDDLFCQLQNGANTLEDAVVIQDLVKELWKESSNSDMRSQIDNGIADLLDGKHQRALDTFSDIVASDPLYGEAWNKKATVHYMMGETENSIEAAEEALKIDDRNFQALAGIGLIEMDGSRYENAESAFRRCLAINPWLSTVSSKLSVCVSKKDDGSELP